jgi:hypothetical protein
MTKEGVPNAMLPSERKKALTVLLLATLGLATGLLTDSARSPSVAAEKGTQAAEPKPVVGFSPAEFQQLKPILDVKNQPWASIPWKYSITEARKVAAATKKPIFMVVNTGNALGCT